MNTSHLRNLNSRFTQAKSAVLRRLTSEFGRTLSPALIRRALLEAEQAANQAGYPHLLFPVLAEENVRRVSAVLSPEFADSGRPVHPIAA